MTAIDLRSGDLVAPTSMGCCGRCGFANFRYSNGHEFSSCGVRGYRCVYCLAVKAEDWRSRAKKE